jgi:hypothetical protein
LDKAPLILLISTLSLVPALGILGDVVGVGFVFRYVAWMTIPYALLLGAGAGCWRGSKLAAAAVAALLAVNVYAIYNRHFDARYAEEDYRAVAQKLDELEPERRPVLVASHYMGAALRYYIGDTRPLDSFPIFASRQSDRDESLARFFASRRSGERYWIVSQWLPPDDDRRSIRDAALERFNAKLEAELHQAEIYSASVP